MLIVTGWRSAITQALLPLLPPSEEAKRVVATDPAFPLGAERYLFAQGLLRSKTEAEQTTDERAEGYWVNAGGIMDACDRVIGANDRARICIIGSHSAYTGSYDGTYAEAKRALHAYVETRRLRTPDQQLVAVAPTIIGDASMTLRRHDLDAVAARAERHPKRRWLTAEEVARLVRFLLYEDRGYISGTVVRVHGGSPEC